MMHLETQKRHRRMRHNWLTAPLSAPLALPILLGLGLSSGACPAGTAEGPITSVLQAQEVELEPTEFARKLGLGYAKLPGMRSLERRNDRGQDILFVADTSEPPGWNISFQRLTTPELGETTKSRVDTFLEGLQARGDSATLRSRITRGIRLMGGKETDLFPAELVYLNIPLPDDETGVSGLLVVQTTPNTFLYGTLFALPDAFESGGKESIEALIDSLRIQPSITEEEINATRINNGAAILGAFSPELVRSVATANINEFYRIYTRNQAGEIAEVGWQQLTTKLAPLSELQGINTQREATQQDGLLVTIKGEIVEFFPERQITIDIVSSHWLSLDRTEGQWSTIRTSRRILEAGGNRTETEVGSPSAETGVRTRPQPRSTVTIIDSSGVTERLDIPASPNPYLSQAELYVLGHLIRGAELDAFEADWYTMDREANGGAAIRKRSDSFQKDEATGRFTMQSLGGSGRFEQEFTSNGSRLRRSTPMNEDTTLILEQIDPKDLVELYKQKNLPIR